MFAIVIRHSPYSSQLAREGLEAALACAAFGQDVRLYFLDEGVWAALAQQQGQLNNRKDLGKMLGALSLYDIEHAYVDLDSLQRRGLSLSDIHTELQVVESSHWQHQLRQATHVLSF